MATSKTSFSLLGRARELDSKAMMRIRPTVRVRSRLLAARSESRLIEL